MAEPMGPQSTALRVLAGDFPADAQSLFAGLDTTLSQQARTVGAAPAVSESLEAYEHTVGRVRADYNPLRSPGTDRSLIDALKSLDAAAATLAGSSHTELLRRVRIERAQTADALLLEAGLLVDVVADTPTPVPGTSFGLSVAVWNGGSSNVALHAVEPVLPPGWTYTSEATQDITLAPDQVMRQTYTVSVPESAQPTEPYFLRTERAAAMYSWSAVADTIRALPFQPAAVTVELSLDIGASITLRRSAEFAMVDKAVGELRRPLIVVPAAAVSVEPGVAAIPAADTTPRRVSVTVSAARDSMAGVVRLHVPSGWQVAPAAAELTLSKSGDSRTTTFAVTPPQDAAGEYTLRATFESHGVTYDEGYALIDYPHIRPHPLYRDADVRAVVFPVTIARNLRIGYIEGAGDGAADALRQLGAVVEALDADVLANANLAAYDAIVAGIRAYEVRPDLVANNRRLLDYARGGGTFVVQYNKYELVDGGFLPFPATMSRPHGRVTDETAAVTLLQPDHPVLSWPNRITADDFAGWVQERGLYFLDTFDSRYVPLLSMADPGEAPQTGSLVVARVGDGWYVYTGVALFRQLPEAVPGAYRLLANLVSLGNRAPAEDGM